MNNTARPAAPAVRPTARQLARGLFLAGLLALAAAPAPCQEAGFGFGGEADRPAAPALTVHGSVGLGATVYLDDPLGSGSAGLGNLAGAVLELSSQGAIASASLSLRLSPARLGADPGSLLDQARLGLYLGPASLEAGLMKLAWGRADAGGPLDVLNPLDLSDLSVDPLDRKIAVPMARARLSLGETSELQAAWVPGVRGNAYAPSGRWEPKTFRDTVPASITAAALASGLAPAWGLGRSQAGLRFATSSAGVDLGAQYFYGFLRDPVLYVPRSGPPSVGYVRYHQIGLDAAGVLAGFSLRGEAALNLTSDLSGGDPAVPNPAIAFDLGLERALPADFSLALRCAGSYRLATAGLATAADVEYGRPALSATLSGTLAWTLLKGALTAGLGADWGISDSDYLVRPSLVLNFGDGIIGLYGGFYGGSASGALGQYAGASYLRAGLSYTF